MTNVTRRFNLSQTFVDDKNATKRYILSQPYIFDVLEIVHTALFLTRLRRSVWNAFPFVVIIFFDTALSVVAILIKKQQGDTWNDLYGLLRKLSIDIDVFTIIHFAAIFNRLGWPIFMIMYLVWDSLTFKRTDLV